MTIRHVNNLKTPIGDLLKDAQADGLLVEGKDKKQYAMIPLDDDLIDYLLERNPTFIQECQKIRQRMRAGQFQGHEAVKKKRSRP
jgi:hypothetical protein